MTADWMSERSDGFSAPSDFRHRFAVLFILFVFRGDHIEKFMIKKIVSFILVIVFSVPMLSACGAMSDDAPTIKVGQTVVSLEEFRYQYNNSLELFKKTYASRIESTNEIDFSKSLDEQIRDEKTGSTWADYFRDYTVRSLKNYLVLAEDARVNGKTLSENDIAMIDEQIEYVKQYISDKGLTDEEYFGKGMTIDDYRMTLERNLLGSNRYYEYIDTLEVPYEESVAHAKASPEKYLGLSYYYYEFKASDYNASYSNASAAAKTFIESLTDINDFEKVLYDTVLTDAEKTEYTEGKYFVKDIYYPYLDRNLQKWGFEAGREIGDHTIITGTDGMVLYVFAGLDLPEYLTYNYRSIAIPASDTLEGKAAVSEARSQAEKIVEEWENGGKGEDLYASLAMKYSKDSSTNKNGGLYENTAISGLGDGSFDWITSSERTYGDVSVFTTADCAFIIYYIGEGIPVWQAQAENAIMATKFNEHIEDLADKYNFKIYEKVINRVE